MSESIKTEFGKSFRSARDAKGLSRAALGVRLGVSPKTIQSWEMGRTFIEDLSLIPAIESELDISVAGLIERATTPGAAGRVAVAAEPPSPYGRRNNKKNRPLAGPATAQFDIHVVQGPALPDGETLGETHVAIPLLRPRAAAKPVADLEARDVAQYVLAPGAWVPRGGVLVAYRMGDSSMSPMIPLGGTVIVDRRSLEMRRALNRIVALYLQDRGLRIRRLLEDPSTGKLTGMPAIEDNRGKAPFREERGDMVLGRVVGVLAQPE